MKTSVKSFGDILKELRIKHGFTARYIASALNEMGITATATQISRWENGYNNPNIEQFLGICKMYDIHDPYRIFIERDFSSLTSGLNKEGIDRLEEIKKIFIASGMFSPIKIEEKVIRLPRRTKPLFDLGASAGTGQFLDSDNYEMVEVPDDVPDCATFGLHVCGDSMEPTLKNGSIIWVKLQPTIEDGELGVFLIDGDAFVKEFRITENGAFLLSHNPKYPPIAINESNDVKIYGKVVHCTI